jgi:hypothetical protein
MKLPILDSDHPTFVYRQDDGRLPRALVFRNSFFTFLMPFFGEHFRESVILWRYFETDYLDQVHPDIVVEQLLEMEFQAPADELGRIFGDSD